jgi:hypothetical protein
LLKRLKEEGFRPKINQDSRGHLTSLFFLYPKARKLWKRNPDVLFLDSTYKTNQFGMPLLNIRGVTDNDMTIQIAICFLYQETEPAYNWALDQLRHVLNKGGIEEPRTIISDREKALINAVSKSFPSTKHTLCQ